METRKRSLVKALVWNAIGLASMTLVGVVATGSAGLSGAMALINAALGFASYLIYERVWTRISWGLSHTGGLSSAEAQAAAGGRANV
jgi:uncharacterized membrane protein